MPFKSYKQMALMKKKEPKIYARWMRKYGPYKSGKLKKAQGEEGGYSEALSG